ncbi:hypothetical protein NDU88_001826 [Pleurodeles waltl]|uniref:Uncharacterized protein n=1 Tax=Pleurodeles waltl TaxID=8319 RepID=A0AAV7WPU9_PLEWA|nr:hypothetical protein NDU88_001826 [Pleurodeles waltl]
MNNVCVVEVYKTFTSLPTIQQLLRDRIRDKKVNKERSSVVDGAGLERTPSLTCVPPASYNAPKIERLALHSLQLQSQLPRTAPFLHCELIFCTGNSKPVHTLGPVTYPQEIDHRAAHLLIREKQRQLRRHASK